jgi:hypothetical protein
MAGDGEKKPDARNSGLERSVPHLCIANWQAKAVSRGAGADLVGEKS